MTDAEGESGIKVFPDSGERAEESICNSCNDKDRCQIKQACDQLAEHEKTITMIIKCRQWKHYVI